MHTGKTPHAANHMCIHRLDFVIRFVLRTAPVCIQGVPVWTEVALALLLVMMIGCAPSPAVNAAETSPAAWAAPPSREVTAAANPEHLISRYVDSPPVIDGRVDAVWQAARPKQVRLTWGTHSTELAFEVGLQSVHTDDAVHFLAKWPGSTPTGEENVISNRFTLHWRIPESEALSRDCDVSCHTAHADGNGRFAYANAETIPQGGNEALPVAGGWENGLWTLEWSSPLISSNPFDLQFGELDGEFPFFVKVFERVEGRADPVSDRHFLVFEP
jgi:hypothetical protein